MKKRLFITLLFVHLSSILATPNNLTRENNSESNTLAEAESLTEEKIIAALQRDFTSWEALVAAVNANNSHTYNPHANNLEQQSFEIIDNRSNQGSE